MSQSTPDYSQIESAVKVADRAAMLSAEARKKYARRRSPRRESTLNRCRERCSEAAKPLRSYIGMIAWHDLPVDVELMLKNAIAKLRYERRQLDKML